MKKIIVFLSIIIVGIMNVEAREFSFQQYKELNITQAYIVGEYVFDTSSGYSPNLLDIMVASRSIPEGKTTTMYEASNMEMINYSSLYEVYTNRTIDIEHENIVFDLKYVYRANIKNAQTSDFDIIS